MLQAFFRFRTAVALDVRDFFVPRDFAATDFVAFFAGVRLLLAILFCSNAMKSTTLPELSSAAASGSTLALIFAPLRLSRARIARLSFSRNSSLYLSGLKLPLIDRSAEHTSETQSLMRTTYA